MCINYNDFFVTYCPFRIFLYVALVQTFFSFDMFLSNILSAILKKKVVEYFISHNIESHMRGKPICELLLSWQLNSHLKFPRLIGMAICEHLSKRCHNSDSIRRAY
jgi:hypothetical protein